MNDTAIYVGIGLAILWQGVVLYNRQQEFKRKLKKLEDDLVNKSIEWSGDCGSIDLKRKNYPTELKHYHDECVEEPKEKLP